MAAPYEWSRIDALTNNPAKWLPPVRWGWTSIGEISGRLYYFGGAVLTADIRALQDKEGFSSRYSDSGSKSYMISSEICAYSVESAVWYPVQPRNGQRDADLPMLLDTVDVLSFTATQSPTHDSDDNEDSTSPVPHTDTGTGGGLARVRGRRASLSQRRSSVSSSSFLAALPLHCPSARTGAAGSSNPTKIALCLPGTPLLQHETRLRMQQAQAEGVGIGAEEGAADVQLFPVTTTVVECPTAGVFWVHGGQGAKKSVTEMPQAPHPPDDLPVEAAATSIGSTHGFQMHGAHSLGSLLSGTGGNQVQHDSGPHSDELAACPEASPATLAMSASVKMLGTMLRGGGSGTVNLEIFDDFYAFDTQSHTWRLIDTTANALHNGMPTQREEGAQGGGGMADAFARPRPRRGHSLNAYTMVVSAKDSSNDKSQPWTLVPRLVVFGGAGFFQARGDVCFSDLWVVEDARPGKETFRCIHSDAKLVSNKLTEANGGSRFGYGVDDLEQAEFEAEYQAGVDDGFTYVLDGMGGDIDDVATEGRSKFRTVPPGRCNHATVVVGNGLYIFGGASDTGVLRDLWRLDLINYLWTKIGPFPDRATVWPPALHQASMCVDPDPEFATRRFYLSGGRTIPNPSEEAGVQGSTVWRFDLGSMSWDELPLAAHQPAERFHHSMVALNALRLALPVPRDLDPFYKWLSNAPYGHFGNAATRRWIKEFVASQDQWITTFVPRPEPDKRSARQRAREATGIAEMIRAAEQAASYATAKPLDRTGISVARLQAVSAKLASRAAEVVKAANDFTATIPKPPAEQAPRADVKIAGQSATLAGVIGGRKRSMVLRVAGHLTLSDAAQATAGNPQAFGGNVHTESGLIDDAPRARISPLQALQICGLTTDPCVDLVLKGAEALYGRGKPRSCRVAGPGYLRESTLVTSFAASVPRCLHSFGWQRQIVLPAHDDANDAQCFPRVLAVTSSAGSRMVSFAECAKFLHRNLCTDLIYCISKEKALNLILPIVDDAMCSKLIIVGGIMLKESASSEGGASSALTRGQNGVFASLRDVYMLSFRPAQRKLDDDVLLPAALKPFQENDAAAQVDMSWRLLHQLREALVPTNVTTLAANYEMDGDSILAAKAQVAALRETGGGTRLRQLETLLALHEVRTRSYERPSTGRVLTGPLLRSCAPHMFITIPKSHFVVDVPRSSPSRSLANSPSVVLTQGGPICAPSSLAASRSLPVATNSMVGDELVHESKRSLMTTLAGIRPSTKYDIQINEPPLHVAVGAVEWDGVSFKRGVKLTTIANPDMPVNERAIPFGVPRLAASQSAKLLLTAPAKIHDTTTPLRTGLRRVPQARDDLLTRGPTECATPALLGSNSTRSLPRAFGGSSPSGQTQPVANSDPVVSSKLSPAARRRALAALSSPFGKPMPMVVTSVMKPVDTRSILHRKH